MTWERGTSAVAARSGVLVGLLMGLMPAVALAQSAVPAPLGIKMGEGRVHPFVSLSAHYDSLIGYFGVTPAGTLIPSSDIIVSVSPGLKFDLDTPSTLVAFGGNASYLWYTGLLAPGATGLSRFQGQANLDASFNRAGAAEVKVSDTFTRSDRTQNIAVGVGVLSLYNSVGLGVALRPGGGALEISPSAGWAVEMFDPLLTGVVSGCTNAADITCNPSLVGRMNYNNLNVSLSAKWKFLPKTAVLLNTGFDYRTYFVNDQSVNPDARVLRAQVGLLGLVSPHVSVTVLAGYGGNFLTNLNTFIANADVSYLFAGNSKISLGYVRTLQPVPHFGTFIDDTGKLSAAVGLLGGRLSLGAALTVDYVSFAGPENRHDLVFGAGAGPSFDVTSWFQVSASYAAALRSSTNTQLASINYVRHEASLQLTFRY